MSRHNERDGISNHQRLDCLLNCLFRRRSEKTSKLRFAGLCEGNSPVTGELHKRPVMRKMFPFDDFVMATDDKIGINKTHGFHRRRSGSSLNIKALSCQHRDTVLPTTVVGPSYLYGRNLYSWKDCFYIETGLDICFFSRKPAQYAISSSPAGPTRAYRKWPPVCWTSAGRLGPWMTSARDLSWCTAGAVPPIAWRNNNIVITSKRRHFDVNASKWRRFDVITTSLSRNVSAGVTLLILVYSLHKLYRHNLAENNGNVQ